MSHIAQPLISIALFVLALFALFARMEHQLLRERERALIEALLRRQQSGGQR